MCQYHISLRENERRESGRGGGETILCMGLKQIGCFIWSYFLNCVQHNNDGAQLTSRICHITTLTPIYSLMVIHTNSNTEEHSGFCLKKKKKAKSKGVLSVYTILCFSLRRTAKSIWSENGILFVIWCRMVCVMFDIESFDDLIIDSAIARLRITDLLFVETKLVTPRLIYTIQHTSQCTSSNNTSTHKLILLHRRSHSSLESISSQMQSTSHETLFHHRDSSFFVSLKTTDLIHSNFPNDNDLFHPMILVRSYICRLTTKFGSDEFGLHDESTEKITDCIPSVTIMIHTHNSDYMITINVAFSRTLIIQNFGWKDFATFFDTWKVWVGICLVEKRPH